MKNNNFDFQCELLLVLSVLNVTWQINKQTFWFTEGVLSEKRESSDICVHQIFCKIYYFYLMRCY